MVFAETAEELGLEVSKDDETATDAAVSNEALLRTRTADPLLTMEVLYH